MKHLKIIYILFLFTNCNYKDVKSTIKYNQELKNAYKLEDIKALYFINEKEKLNLSIFSKRYNAIDIDSLITQDINAHFFDENIKNLDISKNSVLIKKVNSWLGVKNSIDFAIDNSEETDYLEFFYKNNNTKNLFNKYLKISSQDWGSLSSSQQYEIYYLIITEIYSLNPKDRLTLVSDFYNYINSR